MVNIVTPILYSFRRCPFAIRARLALAYAGIRIELREVLLKAKPAALLEASAKATVPVLVLSCNEVLDESWDVVLWATAQNDPQNWRGEDDAHIARAKEWVFEADTSFKPWLDKYKYADRYPEHGQAFYRKGGEVFLQKLEATLQHSSFLQGDSLSVADIAVFPLLRQFAAVDPHWFASSPYPRSGLWLDGMLKMVLFREIMVKYPPWSAGDKAIYLP